VEDCLLKKLAMTSLRQNQNGRKNENDRKIRIIFEKLNGKENMCLLVLFQTFGAHCTFSTLGEVWKN
jgi:hypothetical protein